MTHSNPAPNGRVSAIVLAAGEGSRMKSNRPKPLHLICGRPMVMHVIHALSGVQPERTVVVVGHELSWIIFSAVGPTTEYVFNTTSGAIPTLRYCSS